MGQLNVIGIDDFQKSALTYRKELLMMPILALSESLQHMTLRPGIRYGERVGSSSVNAQFAPYKRTRRTDLNLDVVYRELNTFFGSIAADFEPNSAISTILGHLASMAKGDGQMQTPTAKEVLALIARQAGENLNNVLFSAVRNATGDTSADLFNGFDTITNMEILAGEISTTKGNLITLNEAITKANACDMLKGIVYELDPRLRAQNLKMYCSQNIADLYNESYLLTHGSTPYNQQFNKTFIEGSNNKVEIVPLSNKAGSDFIHITSKENMLVGCDQMGDMESIDVKEYAPFVLTFIATMFFGVQIESIDKRMFKAVKLYKESNESAPSGPSETSGQNESQESQSGDAGETE